MYKRTQQDEQIRHEQLETLTSVLLKQHLNDDTYNSLIDQCNQKDEEVQNFFNSLAKNDLADVKRLLFLNPLLAYEVNDRVETALHIAVRLNHNLMAEYLVE